MAAAANDKAEDGTIADFNTTNARYEDFGQGFVLDYPTSVVVHRWNKSAPLLLPGERFWPAKLTSQSDGERQWSTGIMRSDGRWRVVVLAADVAVPEQMARVQALCGKLDGEEGVIRRFTPAEGKKDAVIDVMAVHSADRSAVDIFDFPEILRPEDEMRGLDYHKIWVDEAFEFDQDCDGKAYEKWGVDRSRGSVLVMRPDQCIGWYGDLEDVAEMEKYFEGVLKVRV